MKGFRHTIRMNPYLRWLLIGSYWLSQGIIHADITEKTYKILFSIITSVLIAIVFFDYVGMTVGRSIVLGIIFGHSLNWIINSNFYNIIIHRLYLSTLDKNNAFDYLDSLAQRLHGNSSILYVTSHGSICTGNLKSTSDIDVALIRRTGIKNALESIFFVTREKKIADFRGIPLEIYLMDAPEAALKRFKEEGTPLVIYDPENMVEQYYKGQISIADAKQINGV